MSIFSQNLKAIYALKLLFLPFSVNAFKCLKGEKGTEKYLEKLAQPKYIFHFCLIEQLAQLWYKWQCIIASVNSDNIDHWNLTKLNYRINESDLLNTGLECLVMARGLIHNAHLRKFRSFCKISDIKITSFNCLFDQYILISCLLLYLRLGIWK